MLVRKMLIPMIKRYWTLFISMIMVSCLGIALMVGLMGAYLSFVDGYNNYIDDYGYPDAVITTQVTSGSMEKELESIEGVKYVNSRMYADFALKTDKRTYTLRIYSFKKDDFSKFYVHEEAAGGNYPEIYIEYKFSQKNDIGAGDIIKINTANGYREFFVSKVVSSPECIYMKQNEYSWGDNSDFGYAFLSSDDSEIVFGSSEYNNQYLIQFESENSIKKENKKLLQECEKTD